MGQGREKCEYFAEAIKRRTAYERRSSEKLRPKTHHCRFLMAAACSPSNSHPFYPVFRLSKRGTRAARPRRSAYNGSAGLPARAISLSRVAPGALIVWTGAIAALVTAGTELRDASISTEKRLHHAYCLSAIRKLLPQRECRLSLRESSATFAERKATVYLAAALLCLSGCTSFSDYVHNGFKVGPEYSGAKAAVAPKWIDAADALSAARPPTSAAGGASSTIRCLTT